LGHGETDSLLARACEGESAALEALYARCARKLLPLIRLRLGPSLRARMESGDVLQAVLLKSWRAFPKAGAERPRSFMAWLARIAENEIRDRADFEGRARRDAGLEKPLDEVEPPAPVRSAVTQAVLRQELLRLAAALETLEPAYRDVIIWRKLEELSYREIGQRLGKSDDAVRMLLARALTALTVKVRGAG